jgi:hypothetical protein
MGQQQATPVVGFMSSGSPGPLRRQLAAIREGLKEAGHVDGQNVVIDFRFAEGQFDRFPSPATRMFTREPSRSPGSLTMLATLVCQGYAESREAAMTAFRAAWDTVG